MTDQTPATPQTPASAPVTAQDAPGGPERQPDAPEAPQRPVQRLQRLRDQLAAEQRKARAVDPNARPELRVSPHEGIAAGLSIALFLVEHHLREAGEQTICIHPDGYDGECPCATGCVCCRVVAAQQEQAAPVDWQAIARQRERELKQVGEARHRAESAVARVRQLLAERRTEVAERETDGMLPFGTPGASWCDAVTVTCDRIDDALRDFPPAVGIRCAPAHDSGPSAAEAAADDRQHWQQRQWGGRA